MQQISLIADSSFAKYIWSNGEHTPKISIDSTGTYSVEVIDDFGCISEDSVNVTIETPSIDIGEDIVIDGEQQIEIVAKSENAKSIVWPDGSGGQKYTFNPEKNNTSSLIAYALTDNGCKTSDTIQITMLTKHKNASVEISLYPNPASDYITIYTKSNKNLKFDLIEIFTINGHKVYSNSNVNKANVFKLDVTYLNPGTYLAKVKLGNTFEIIEFVKK